MKLTVSSLALLAAVFTVVAAAPLSDDEFSNWLTARSFAEDEEHNDNWINVRRSVEDPEDNWINVRRSIEDPEDNWVNTRRSVDDPEDNELADDESDDIGSDIEALLGDDDDDATVPATPAVQHTRRSTSDASDTTDSDNDTTAIHDADAAYSQALTQLKQTLDAMAKQGYLTNGGSDGNTN